MPRAKTFPRKPFVFGKYIVEYKEEAKSPANFLKEELNTEAEAEAAADLRQGGWGAGRVKR